MHAMAKSLTDYIFRFLGVRFLSADQRRGMTRARYLERLSIGIDNHHQQRHEQPAVAAIVIGEQRARGRQLLHRSEEPGQPLRIVEVGRRRAHLLVDLRQA